MIRPALLLLVAGLAGRLAAAGYDELATELTRPLIRPDPAVLRIAIGPIRYQDSEFQSAFSSLVRQELELALGRMAGVRVVTREALADLQLEGRFQAGSLATPGTAVATTPTVDGAQVLVRGRYYVNFPHITIYAETVSLEGGAVAKAKTVLVAAEAAADLLPAEVRQKPAAVVQPALGQVLQPQALAASQTALDQVAAASKDVPRHFALHLATVDGRQAYRAGERLGLRLRAGRDCHVAIFCHQSDGSTVLLYPNAFQRDTAVKADQTITIPDPARDGFALQIGAPFGNDVIQAVAASQPTALHQRLAGLGQAAGTYAVLPRAEATTLISRGVGVVEGPAPSPAGLQWSQDYLIISTYP